MRVVYIYICIPTQYENKHIATVLNKKNTYRCRIARATGCKPLSCAYIRFLFRELSEIGTTIELQKWCHRIARTRFAKTPLGSSEYLKSPGCREHFSNFVEVCPPKNEVWGALKGTKVMPSDSPPSICYTALESSEFLKPPGCREHFSIFVGVCRQNWGLGALRGQKWYHRIARL